MKHFWDAIDNYAVFKGRASLRQYWMFVLCYVLLGMGLGMVEIMFELDNAGGGVLVGLYQIATLIPGLAITTRRLHDSGRTGWWQLVHASPFLGWLVSPVFLLLWIVGGIAMFWFLIADTGTELNEYGPPTTMPELDAAELAAS